MPRFIQITLLIVILLALGSIDGACSGSGCPEGQSVASDGRCVGAEGDLDLGEDKTLCADACTGATPICDNTSRACRACALDAECGEPDASRCSAESGACVPCVRNAECAHLPGLGVCSAGTCVECDGASGADVCASGLCDETTRTCATIAPSSQSACSRCVRDEDCTVDHRCVPMTFQGQSRQTGYCLKAAAEGCERPYGVLISRTTTAGAPATLYCGINEETTTCESLQALLDDRACSGGTHPECGVSTLDDGVCSTVNGFTNHCTIRCETSKECPSTLPCRRGLCGGPAF